MMMRLHVFVKSDLFSGTVSTWMIVETMGSKEANMMAKAEMANSKGLKFIPWGGVAARIVGNSFQPVAGRAFCFLPLQLATNLSVHVNGYFIVGSDRRELWKDPRGEGGEGLKKINWYFTPGNV